MKGEESYWFDDTYVSYLGKSVFINLAGGGIIGFIIFGFYLISLEYIEAIIGGWLSFIMFSWWIIICPSLLFLINKFYYKLKGHYWKYSGTENTLLISYGSLFIVTPLAGGIILICMGV